RHDHVVNHPDELRRAQIEAGAAHRINPGWIGYAVLQGHAPIVRELLSEQRHGSPTSSICVRCTRNSGAETPLAVVLRLRLSVGFRLLAPRALVLPLLLACTGHRFSSYFDFDCQTTDLARSLLTSSSFHR